MATTVARLVAVLSADTGQFDRAMDRSDGRMKGLAKTMGKAGLAGGLLGLGAAVKVGVGEFMEAQKVTAQTNAVLKSTGGVAGVTTKQVQGLSEALMKKSGVDDEAIQSGQNMLLTFTKIRNETGKGNDVFNQATKATLNLSVAMGKDMQSSAILVGKALNDPVKGAAALSRAGVQLTQDQKDMIKQLVEGSSAAYALSTTLDEKLTPAQYKAALQMEKAGMSVKEIADKLNLEYSPAQIKAAQEATRGGKTIEAQKILLKELETQFGGSAEAAGKTFAGQISIARERLNNFAGSMVERSIPVMQEMVRVVNEHLVPAFRSVVSWVGDNIVPTLRQMWTVAREVWQGIAAVLKENEPQLRRIFGVVEDIGQMMLWLVNKVVLPVLKPMLTKALPDALNITIEVFAKFAAVIDRIVDGIKWLIENVKKIPTPSLPSLPNIPGIGDAHDPSYAGLNLMGASPVMAPFAYAASRYGLQVTSGLRPGAITANGTPSDHGVGKALDVAGSASAMAAFFMSLIGNKSVKQAFYDPRGSIFGGAWSSYREGGHSDHVHVATYDKGGWLRPGWNLAYNGLGRPEPVGGMMPNRLILDLGDLGIVEMVRRGKQRFERLNGPGSW